MSVGKVAIRCFAFANLDTVIILHLGGVTRIRFLDQTRRKVVCFVTGTGWVQCQGDPEILETSGHSIWYQMVKIKPANSPAAKGLE